MPRLPAELLGVTSRCLVIAGVKTCAAWARGEFGPLPEFPVYPDVMKEAAAQWLRITDDARKPLASSIVARDFGSTEQFRREIQTLILTGELPDSSHAKPLMTDDDFREMRPYLPDLSGTDTFVALLRDPTLTAERAAAIRAAATDAEFTAATGPDEWRTRSRFALAGRVADPDALAALTRAYTQTDHARRDLLQNELTRRGRVPRPGVTIDDILATVTAQIDGSVFRRVADPTSTNIRFTPAPGDNAPGLLSSAVDALITVHTDPAPAVPGHDDVSVEHLATLLRECSGVRSVMTDADLDTTSVTLTIAVTGSPSGANAAAHHAVDQVLDRFPLPPSERTRTGKTVTVRWSGPDAWERLNAADIGIPPDQVPWVRLEHIIEQLEAVKFATSVDNTLLVAYVDEADSPGQDHLATLRAVDQAEADLGFEPGTVKVANFRVWPSMEHDEIMQGVATSLETIPEIDRVLIDRQGDAYAVTVLLNDARAAHAAHRMITRTPVPISTITLRRGDVILDPPKQTTFGPPLPELTVTTAPLPADTPHAPASHGTRALPGIDRDEAVALAEQAKNCPGVTDVALQEADTADAFVITVHLDGSRDERRHTETMLRRILSETHPRPRSIELRWQPDDTETHVYTWNPRPGTTAASSEPEPDLTSSQHDTDPGALAEAEAVAEALEAFGIDPFRLASEAHARRRASG